VCSYTQRGFTMEGHHVRIAPEIAKVSPMLALDDLTKDASYLQTYRQRSRTSQPRQPPREKNKCWKALAFRTPALPSPEQQTLRKPSLDRPKNHHEARRGSSKRLQHHRQLPHSDGRHGCTLGLARPALLRRRRPSAVTT
jgi:hypothetical protein